MSAPPHSVAFLLVPDFSTLGLALAIEPLFVANWLAQRPLFAWSTLSVDGAPVPSSSRQLQAVDGSIEAAGRPRTIFAVASFNVKQHAGDRRLTRWLARQARFGAQVGAIETGSEILAAAGLLEGREAAVHWDNLEGFRERYPGVRAEPRLYTLEPDRVTCAGASAVLDMMLAWIARRADAALADEVARHLLPARVRPGEEPQAGSGAGEGGPLGEAVRHAVRLMEEAIEEPLTPAEIARRVGLSPRQLQRHFRLQLGTTPKRHYTMVRLSKAHKLLQQTDLPVTEVAMGCGFATAETFSRLYREVFGRPPSRDRRQSTCAPVFRQAAVGSRR